MYLIDAHCHLHSPWFEDDLDEVITAARDVNIQKIVNCASHPKNFSEVMESTQHDNVYATLGMQPTLMDKYQDSQTIKQYIGHEKLVAIGESGLDYYWVKEEKKRTKQEKLFLSSIELANEEDLPLVVHTRKAESECLDILEKHAVTPVLLHSFDGNLKEVNRAIDLGYLISVPTIITRRRNRRKVTTRAGLDNIMIETDAPFCQPDDEIERNEPKYIPQAAEYMANLLEIDINELMQTTSKNAEKFYNI